MKVLIINDGKAGPTATQVISFVQPFAGASEADIAFEPDYRDQADIEQAFVVQGPDLLVLSRYTSDRGRHWVALARSFGIPVIFHIDDDLLAVPASVGESKYKAYNAPERLQALRTNIESSDLCYVSTAPLAEALREHGIQVPIVAGDIYCSVAPDEIGALIAAASGPVIGYMGTGGHSADLALVLPAISQAMDAVPSLNFEVFGTIKMPAELARFGRRARHLAAVADYSDFMPYLRSLGWWIGLAPLEDNAFNRCKADTKWVEYSAAGMTVVASDLPVYHHACAGGAGILASTGEQWREAIMTLLLEPDRRQAMVERAQAKLRERYSHQRLRQQVLDVFDQARQSALAAGAISR